jgi:DEAD/DEAH box helicase domain-containing protein
VLLPLQGPLQPPSAAWLRYTGPLEHPAQAVNLRTIDPERYVIYDVTSRTVLEEIEANMAFYEIYDGAIYLYQVSDA